MPTLDEVKEQLKHISTSQLSAGRLEIKQLPNILWENEMVEGMVAGAYENGSGAVFSTNRRIILVYKGLLFGLRVEDFPYEKITSIQYKTGLVFGEITIFVSENKAKITQMDKKLCKTFAEVVRQKITVKSQEPKNLEDKYTRLEKLNNLRLSGALSEAEFLKEKEKLLS